MRKAEFLIDPNMIESFFYGSKLGKGERNA